MKKLFLIFFGLAVCGVFLEAQTLDEAVLRAALRIGADLPVGATVAVIHFRSDTEKLSDYVINELHGAILRNRRVTPVKPDEMQLQTIRGELRFNQAGEIEGESVRSIGLLLKAQYLATGSLELTGSGYEIVFTAVDAESAERRSRYSASVNLNDQTLATLLGRTPVGSAPAGASSPPAPVDPNAWKNKWVYLGGMIGGGMYNESIGLFAPGFVSEFALLPFFSIELSLSYWLGPGFGALPILAKVGYRFAQIELFFDIGYAIGPPAGFTVGGTFGVHLGPGVLFTKFIGMPPSSEGSSNSAWVWSVGYKWGVGNTKKTVPKAPQPDSGSDEVPQADTNSGEASQADTSGDEVLPQVDTSSGEASQADTGRDNPRPRARARRANRHL
jgi:hypothetical protein